MAVRDDRGDVKQTTTGFRGPLMVQSLTSAKSKFLSLDYGDIGNTQLLLADILANTDQEKEALKMAKAAKKSYKITEDEELVGKADELIKEIQSSVESK